MSEKHETPAASPDKKEKQGAGTEVAKVAEDTQAKVKATVPTAPPPVPPAAPSHPSGEKEDEDEDPVIPTPGFLAHKSGPELPDAHTFWKGLATAIALAQPPAIPAILAAYGLHKARGLARKFPPYRWVENAATSIVSVPWKGIKALGSTAYKLVVNPVNKVLNIPRAVGRGAINVANYILDIPRDIIDFIESAVLKTGEKHAGRNTIDRAAAGILGIGKWMVNLVKGTVGTYPKTSIAIALMLFGASQTVGIPAFISSLATQSSVIASGLMSKLGVWATTASTAAPAAVAPTTASPGVLKSAAKWLLGIP